MLSGKINDTMHYGTYSDSIIYEEENKYEETQTEDDVPNINFYEKITNDSPISRPSAIHQEKNQSFTY